MKVEFIRMDSISPDTPQKQCGKCKGWKPATSTCFGFHKSAKDGFANTCKECRKEIYDSNREQILEQKRDYHQRNRESRNQYRKRYYANHAEELRAQKRAYRKDSKQVVETSKQKYYSSHRDQIREYHRKYRKSHPDKIAQHAQVKDHNRRARKQFAPGTYTATDIQAQYKRQKGHCYWCGKALTKYHIDHIIPLAKDGSNWPDNLVLSCQHCNLSKGTKLPHEWPQGNRLL